MPKGIYPGNKGKHLTKEQREKFISYNYLGSLANLGRKLSKEHKEKISKKLKGRIVSKITREKMSKRLIENNPTKILEVRNKISKSRLGKKLSKKTKEKISKKLKGRIFSKSHREKIGKAVSIYRKGKYCGKDNFNWQGGISFKEYSLKWTLTLKENIRKRDCYFCQLCGKPQKKLNKILFIHHIDYNKQNCNFNNLISLCNKCHSKTNGKRNYWKRYFKIKLCKIIKIQ